MVISCVNTHDVSDKYDQVNWLILALTISISIVDYSSLARS